MSATYQTFATPADVPGPDEAYAAVKGLIVSTVDRFRRRYGGDFDDLLGEAHILFMKGMAQYRRGTTPTGIKIQHPFHTEIRRWVWYGLFDAFRVGARRNAIVGISSDTDSVEMGATTDRSWQDFELGADAQLVLRLIQNTPKELGDVISAKGGEPRNIRSSVRAWLVQCKWTTARIAESFNEIQEVLG